MNRIHWIIKETNENPVYHVNPVKMLIRADQWLIAVFYDKYHT